MKSIELDVWEVLHNTENDFRKIRNNSINIYIIIRVRDFMWTMGIDEAKDTIVDGIENTIIDNIHQKFKT